MKIKYLLSYALVITISGLLLWLGLNPHIFWPHWVLENFLLHSTIEAIGGLIAIVMALMLLFQWEEVSEGGRFFSLAVGFMGMGLLDIFHAVVLPGRGFILLHSMAVLVGGLGFGLSWLAWPVRGRYKLGRWSMWATVVVCVSFIIPVMLHREIFPQMVQNGRFTFTAMAINLTGGLLSILGAANFLLAFYCSGQWEDYLFGFMAVLFGLAGILFKYSSLWNDTWWLWHFVRLSAYFLVLRFLIRRYLSAFSSLRETNLELKQSSEKNKKAKEFTEAILNSMSDSVCIIDVKNFKITDANRAFLNLLNLSKEEIIGRTCYALTHNRKEPCSPPEDPCPLFDTLKTGKISLAQHWHYLKDGQKRYIDISTVPMRNEKGEIIQVLHTSRDITEQKGLQDKLQESEEKYRHLFEKTQAGMYRSRIDGSAILDVNKKWLQILGYSKEEIAGKSASIIWANPQKREPFIQQLKEKGVIVDYEVELLTKVGEIRTCLVSASIFPAQGIIEGTIIDITERKKTEEVLRKYLTELEIANEKLRLAMNEIQEKDQRLLDTNEELEAALHQAEAQRELVLAERNRLDAVIQGMGEGVLVIDKKKDVELMNERAKEILGFSDQGEIPEGYKKSFILRLWKELRESKGKIIKKEMNLERPREAILLVTLARFTKEEEEEEGFVAILRDVTAEKQIEQMKSDFVANVSHEIRSPLAPMKDALGIVLDGTAGELNEQQKRFLAILDTNMHRLGRLIDDLLDLSKIQAGRLELKKEKVDTIRLLEEVAASMRFLAEKKNIELSFDFPEDLPQTYCDRDRIIQVMLNLITNAIKFTPEGGQVSVKVSEYQSVKEKDVIQVAVSDSGPGMSAEETDTLFDRFKQLSHPEAIKGTGLGLALSKAIIQMHGGRIWVESQVGKGSTFKFTLPVNTDKHG
jgi:PAS domain S-box-containing protein